MTLCDENGSLAILAVEVDIIRETLSHTLGTREDAPAAYGHGQLEPRRTETMLVLPDASQNCSAVRSISKEVPPSPQVPLICLVI